MVNRPHRHPAPTPKHRKGDSLSLAEKSGEQTQADCVDEEAIGAVFVIS